MKFHLQKIDWYNVIIAGTLHLSGVNFDENHQFFFNSTKFSPAKLITHYR